MEERPVGLNKVNLGIQDKGLFRNLTSFLIVGEKLVLDPPLLEVAEKVEGLRVHKVQAQRVGRGVRGVLEVERSFEIEMSCKLSRVLLPFGRDLSWLSSCPATFAQLWAIDLDPASCRG